MRVVTDAGDFTLGTTEVNPTIGIVDYSKRVTDDFGVTTVVQRGFARRMSVRLALPFDDVDALQQRLANLRATSARWIADDRFDWLSAEGFYKDFSLDLSVPPISYCTLTIEGVTETEPGEDFGADPAPDGRQSTLRLLQPTAIAGSALASSNVPETDHAEWSAGTTYALGQRVIRAASHRIYESAANGNVGHNPLAGTRYWLDVGPTNRWAMFDQAVGSLTSASESIVVSLAVASATAVALIDVAGDTVRVQAPGYDQTLPVSAGTMTFLDMPASAGPVTITVSGEDVVAIGTLLIGKLVSLGITEAAPTAGINDFSRKVTDDFGEVSVVSRAWVKRMSACALIRNEAIDDVANRIAAVRAKPSLWIADAGTDSLTIYGFFKDFSIEVGDSVSKLSLAIEGLSQAPAAALVADPAFERAYDPDATYAYGASVSLPDGSRWWYVSSIPASGSMPSLGNPSWENLTPPLTAVNINYPDGTPIDDLRPADPNATEGAPTGTVVHDRAAEQVAADLDFNAQNILAEATLAGAWRVETDAIIFTADGTPVRAVVEQLGITVSGHEVFITTFQEVDGDGVGKWAMAVNADGVIVGMRAIAGAGTSQLAFMASEFLFVDNGGENPVTALRYDDGVWKMASIEVDTLKVNSVVTSTMIDNAVTDHAYAQLTSTIVVNPGTSAMLFSLTKSKAEAASILSFYVTLFVTTSDDLKGRIRLRSLSTDGFGVPLYEYSVPLTLGGTGPGINMPFSFRVVIPSWPAGAETWRIYHDNDGGSFINAANFQSGSNFSYEEGKK